MKPEECYIGQRVSLVNENEQVSEILYCEGTVLAQALILNDYNGLVPSAQVQWDEDEWGISWREVSKLGIVNARQ